MLKSNKFYQLACQSVKQLFLLSVCLFVWKDEPSLTIQTFLRSQVCQFGRHNDKSQEFYDKRRWYHTKMGKRHIRRYL